MVTKRFSSIEVKGDGDEGLVTARFATSGVKDLDGDVIEKGAIGVQDIQVSQFGHASWGGALPVGKGKTREVGDEMLADLEFFLKTTHGREHFETVKALGSLGEWSLGFEIKEERAPSDEERQLGIVRVLKKLEVFEVSPVLRGSGINTATLDAKRCNSCGVASRAASPSPDELRRARRLVADGRRRLEPTPSPAAPSFGAGRLAKFAASVGHRLVGFPGRLQPPEVVWFAPDGVNSAFMCAGEHIVHLALDRRDRELVESVLHECKHVCQDARGSLRGPGAEPEAAEFGRRWAKAVFAAFKWSGGVSGRVVLREGRPPFGDVPRGHIVLVRGDLYHYNSFNRGSAWGRVA